MNKMMYVITGGNPSNDDLEPVFDTLAQAESYLKRFKTESTLQIEARLLNPSFKSHPDTDCWFVSSYTNGKEISFEMDNSFEGSIWCENKQITYVGGPSDCHELFMSLFASSSQDAVNSFNHFRIEGLLNGTIVSGSKPTTS